MSRLSISRSEHNKIRRSSDMQQALADEAARIADECGGAAGDPDGYGHGDVTVGRDRARAHVWAKTGAAFRAERKDSPLMQVVAAAGPRGEWWDGPGGRP